MSIATLTGSRARALARLPNQLSGLRLALVPALLGLALAGALGPFLAVLALSLATDVLDGFLARRLDACSEAGSRLDSRADLATWLSLPLCAWLLRPEVVRAELPWIAAGLAASLGATALGFLRYRRLTSYHTLGAKASAVALGVAIFPMFASGAALPLRAALVLLVLSQIEEVAITCTLRTWHRDVRTWLRARALARAESPQCARVRSRMQ
jgi:phosphatidylglycerophosphate synthase